MKLKTLLPLAFGAAVGYVLGSAAGRGRYEQLKQRAADLVTHPKVQQTVFDVAGDVKDNASNLPGPVAGLVDTAASRLQETLTTPGDSDSSTAAPESMLTEPVSPEPFPASPGETKLSGSEIS